PFKVLPDRVMVKTATSMPTSMSDLERLFPKKSAMKRRYGKGMVRAVVEGREDDFVIPGATKPPPPKGPKPRLTGRVAERTLIGLKEWRNDLISSTAGMSPVTVASNATLKRIAQQRPTTIEELSLVPDVRRWQVRDFGEIMLGVLDSVSPYPPTGEELEDGGDKSAKRRRRRRRKPRGGESADAD
ncbi:MAG: ribonuclease D, partial [Kiritimatiellia bacterium]